MSHRGQFGFKSGKVSGPVMKTTVIMNSDKVDPKAKAFLEYTSEMLEEHGILLKEVRDQCCYDLFETMKKSFNVAALDPGADQDKFLYAMADSINKAGIKDPSIQEEIILKFLVEFKKVGGM
jgi:hypothetical protein